MNPRKDRQLNRQITVHFTGSMFQFLETVASRQKTSIGDVVRQAVREYLDVQEDVMGSRSRMGSRVARQLEEMQNRFLERQVRANTLLLSAIILLQMKQGAQGSQVLAQLVELAAHAGEEIQAALEGRE